MTHSHRATKIDPEVQLQKLHGFINPVQQLWQNPTMDEAISSFGGFCELLGLSQVRDYLVSRHVHEIDDWGLFQLDAQGQAMQKDLEERLKVGALVKLNVQNGSLTLRFRASHSGPQNHSLLAQPKRSRKTVLLIRSHVYYGGKPYQ